MKNDKEIELLRYDTRAQSLLSAGSSALESELLFGSQGIPHILRTPYLYYEQCILQYISKDQDVLELGSGTGLHTHSLTQTGARVVASDISSQSLAVLAQHIRGVAIQVCDMESLPFENTSFDVVACAGSLSYGNPALVDAEVRRVLRPGGMFLCVDSLNHNPVYRLNRWLHYKRGERTPSTLLFMPTIKRIESISRGFQSAEVRYFGSISYLMPVLSSLIGQFRAAKFSDFVDHLVHVRRAAFKFVLVARDRLC